jgi:hypothetical protein
LRSVNCSVYIADFRAAPLAPCTRHRTRTPLRASKGLRRKSTLDGAPSWPPEGWLWRIERQLLTSPATSLNVPERSRMAEPRNRSKCAAASALNWRIFTMSHSFVSSGSAVRLSATEVIGSVGAPNNLAASAEALGSCGVSCRHAYHIPSLLHQLDGADRSAATARQFGQGLPHATRQSEAPVPPRQCR